MTDKALKNFSRSEFSSFLSDLMHNRAKDEAEGDAWLETFISLVPHPAKSDLIYWPEEGADDTPEGITAEIERYCKDNGLPGFKDSAF